MKKLLFVIAGAMLLSTSCIRIAVNTVKGEGEIITESRTFDVDSVSALGVSSGFDVVLDSSVEPGVVEITTYQNVLELVEIKVENGSLEIGMRSGTSCSAERLEARLSPVGLNIFAVSGGADLMCAEKMAIDGRLVVAVSGGADLDFADVAADEAVVAVSGGADVDINGVCRHLEAAVSGGADADLSDLCAETVKADASGGADLEVYATVSYVIEASGAADVEYRDTGAKLDIDSSGAADVKPMD